MTGSILKYPPQFEELPCRPPFRMVWFRESLFSQNVMHVLAMEILALPGILGQLMEAEKERNERLPIFPDVTIVALGSAHKRDTETIVPIWKPGQAKPIEWVRDYGAAWPAGTRFILA